MTGNARLTRSARAGGLVLALVLAATRAPAEAPRLALDTADLLDSDLAAARAATTKPNRIAISPTVRLAYDSNVFQLNPDRLTGGVSDWVTTPGVALQVTRSFGRHSIDLTADAGYDFHKRFTGLDQVRVNVQGRAHLAIGAFCTADPTAAVRIQQNNAAQLDTTAKNSQTVQDYAITLACQRPVGLYPSVTLTRSTVDNADPNRALVDQTAQGVAGGIGYAVPSIGSLLLEVGREWIRQPNRDDLAGASSGSDVTRYAATFTRAVAPRLSFQLGGRYLDVSPRGGGLRDYASGGYDVTVDYHPSPRYALIATATRDVAGSGDVAVSYVVENRYGLRGVARFSSKASLSIAGDYAERRYRGEDPILYPVPRVRERETSVSADLRYDLGQLIRLGAFVRYAVVDARGDLYDYDRTQGGVSVAARF
jgi:hypothetical protein